MRMIVCNVRKPKPNVKKVEELKSLRRFCAMAFVAVEAVKLTTPAPVMAAISGSTKAAAAAATFGIGGPGFIIIEVLLIAIVGGITATIASTIGYGNVARLLVFIGTMVCVGLICDLAGGVVNKVMDFAGMY